MINSRNISMARNTPQFKCSSCQTSYAKWIGKCEVCKKWNTISEVDNTYELIEKSNYNYKKAKIIPFKSFSIPKKEFFRIKTNISEFDRVLGGGIIPGSATILSGDPGIGKSTILLQIASKISKYNKNVFYISGEESDAQISLRAERLNCLKDNVKISSTNNLRNIITTLEQEKPDLVIIDSIQTMWVDTIESAPGSISQVRSSVFEVTNFAKKNNVSVILVGHITKEGQIAGPKLVEHMVDTVLYFEGEKSFNYRILRTIKNRFGPTDEIGVFEMSNCGLLEIKNPSEIFLSERKTEMPGSVVFATIEGTRPLLVEIQALVVKSSFSSSRRSIVGWDNARLSMLLAVLEARCGISFSNYDVYLNVAGGIKINEPAADLAVVAALISSFNSKKIRIDTVIFGELSLSGMVRSVPQVNIRLNEIKKLGFKKAIVPYQEKKIKNNDLKLIEFKNLISFVEQFSDKIIK